MTWRCGAEFSHMFTIFCALQPRVQAMFSPTRCART